MAIYNVTYLMEQYDYDILNESKLVDRIGNLINKLKPHPELGKYRANLIYAENFLKESTGISSKTELEKALDIGNSILNWVASIGGYIKTKKVINKMTDGIYILSDLEKIALIIFVTLFIIKVINYATDINEQQICIKKGEKILAAYDKAIESCNDETLKKELIDNRDEIDRELKALKKEED